jgi:hypothetical protein
MPHSGPFAYSGNILTTAVREASSVHVVIFEKKTSTNASALHYERIELDGAPEKRSVHAGNRIFARVAPRRTRRARKTLVVGPADARKHAVGQPREQPIGVHSWSGFSRSFFPRFRLGVAPESGHPILESGVSGSGGSTSTGGARGGWQPASDSGPQTPNALPAGVKFCDTCSALEGYWTVSCDVDTDCPTGNVCGVNDADAATGFVILRACRIACPESGCNYGRTCCHGHCRALAVDPKNCGSEGAPSSAARSNPR